MRTMVNTIPATGNQGDTLVATLRNRYRCSHPVARADDATLILAYTAWRLADGRDWSLLPLYLRKQNRTRAYAHAHTMHRAHRLDFINSIVRVRRDRARKQYDHHMWTHWLTLTLAAA